MSVTGEPAPWEFVHRTDLLPGPIAWAIGYRADGMDPGLHRGLPGPYLTFILSLEGDVVTGTVENGVFNQQSAHSVLVGGLHTRPAYIVQPRSQTGIQLAVHPLASRALFGVPAAELATLVIDARDLLGEPVARLRDQLGEPAPWTTRFEAVAGYLRARTATAAGRRQHRPELSEAWRWLSRHRGSCPMDALARHVALSTRQLRVICHAELGMGPKTLSRLMRFEHAVGLIGGVVRAGEQPRLADVAVGCGYFDSSHLVRDFQQFSELSPTSWINEERRNLQAGGHRSGPD